MSKKEQNEVYTYMILPLLHNSFFHICFYTLEYSVIFAFFVKYWIFFNS